MGGTGNCSIVHIGWQPIIIKPYMTHFTMHAIRVIKLVYVLCLLYTVLPWSNHHQMIK